MRVERRDKRSWREKRERGREREREGGREGEREREREKRWPHLTHSHMDMSLHLRQENEIDLPFKRGLH